MSLEIKIPPVGESIASALVSKWHKSDGDAVSKGETLVTLETDKVSTELEAEADGALAITVQEGEEVEIGTVIGTLEEGSGSPQADSSPESAASEPESQPSSGESKTLDIKVPAAGESITSATVAEWHVQEGDQVEQGQKIVTLDTDKVSSELEAEEAGQVAIEIAEGTEVSIGAILGTITTGQASPSKPSPAPAKEEAQKPAPEPSPEPKKSTPSQKPAESPKPKPLTDSERATRRKMSPLRRKIADHLVNAQQTAAILTTFNEVDMSAIMGLRKQVQEDFVKKHEVKLGFMSIFTKAVVQALKDVPQVNGFIEGNEIVENHFYDIGVAVGTDKGLVVPVLRDCDQKSFAELEKDILTYAGKAKDGTLGLPDLQGGVFTISNGGVYGSLLSTPILNPPQSAILGMHTIQQRPIAVDGQVVIRPMMYLALSYDHRLIDGKEAVTFLIRIKECLESPTRLMLEI